SSLSPDHSKTNFEAAANISGRVAVCAIPAGGVTVLMILTFSQSGRQFILLSPQAVRNSPVAEFHPSRKLPYRHSPGNNRALAYVVQSGRDTLCYFGVVVSNDEFSVFAKPRREHRPNLKIGEWHRITDYDQSAGRSELTVCAPPLCAEAAMVIEHRLGTCRWDDHWFEVAVEGAVGTAVVYCRRRVVTALAVPKSVQ